MKTLDRFLTIVLLLLLFFSVASSEPTGSIVGIVFDSRSQEPLSNSNIVVNLSPYGAASDLDGEFFIENLPPATYILKASHLGYKTKEISDIVVNSARPTIINIFLDPTDLTGEEVTVTAGYFWREMESPPSVSSLSSEEIRRFPGGFEDVVRAVSTLPGISVVSGQGRNDLLVRGGGPSENLYVVNGMEVPNINHFGTQGFSSGSLSFINLDFVDNVDFSSGGFGVEYGDKLSSVMSLKLRSARPDRIGGKA